jgi:hypothetical protein
MSLDDLDTLLEQIRAQAEFEALLLTDLKGNVIAAARSDEAAPESIGGLLDVAMRIAARPDDRQQLASVGESVFFDWAGRQIICRWFTVKDQPRLFVILAPHGKPYKRAATQLVKEAQRALGE